jgi:hypothetical protein
MQTPSWAHELNETVCREAGVRPVESIVFRRSRRRHSTGRHWKRWKDGRSRVAISVGTSGEAEQRGVFLHELAHHVCSQRRWRAGHDDRFWHTAWTLFMRYGLAPGFMEREFRYRSRAARVAIALQVPGAVEASARVALERRVHRSAAADATLSRKVFERGDHVAFGARVSPAYARGVRAEVVRRLYTRYEVKLLETRGRFRRGTLVRVSPDALIRARGSP